MVSNDAHNALRYSLHFNGLHLPIFVFNLVGAAVHFHLCEADELDIIVLKPFALRWLRRSGKPLRYSAMEEVIHLPLFLEWPE